MDFKLCLTKQLLTQVLSSDFKKTPVYFNWNFLTYWSAITNFEILRELGRGENGSKTRKFKNAMRVYAAELICSTGVSAGFQTFKPVFCILNKLRLLAEMLS